MPEILVQIKRGDLIEAHHYGSYAVVENGRVVRRKGEIGDVTFLRSSAKPFQCYSVVNSGAADAFGLSDKEIAIIVGSHGGEKIHTQAAESILRKGELSERHLLCGVHPPFSERAEGKRSILQNNCSGKHSGMLLLAKFLKKPLKNYTAFSHPVQILNKKAVADFSNFSINKIPLAVDGCSAPTFGLPLKNIAIAFSEFCSGKDECAKRIVDAVSKFPQMLSWSGRLDTEMVRATKGRVFLKAGAEGVYGIGIVDKRIGIAIKIADGSQRPLPYIVLELLKSMGFISLKEYDELSHLASKTIKNLAGINVGKVIVRV